MAPNGGGDLPAGTYVITASLDLTPTTREMWIAQYRAGINRPARRPRGAKTNDDAEQTAQPYRRPLSDRGQFLPKGRVEAPGAFSFTLPAR